MEHHCTTRTAMNHIVAPRPVEPVAGDFYKHPYGGIARDISVTRDGFMRFFELDEIGMKLVYHPDFYGKVLDRMFDEGEALGYRGHHHGIETWTITIIDHSTKAAQKHLVRTIEQYNLKDVEFTHKADHRIKVKIPAKEIKQTWN